MIDLGDMTGEDLSRITLTAMERAAMGRRFVVGARRGGTSAPESGRGNAAAREPHREGSAAIEADRITADEISNWRTIEARSEREFTAIRETLVESGSRFSAEWSPKEERGFFALQAGDFEKARAYAAAGARGELDPRTMPATAQQRAAAILDDRASILFRTVDFDPEAKIISNALSRNGIDNFTVATPDPEGQVLISVASSDAPALVQIAESYIDKGVIEASRFKGLETLRQRLDFGRRTSEKSPQRSLSQARMRAGEIARGRAAQSPELSRTMSR